MGDYIKLSADFGINVTKDVLSEIYRVKVKRGNQTFEINTLKVICVSFIFIGHSIGNIQAYTQGDNWLEKDRSRAHKEVVRRRPRKCWNLRTNVCFNNRIRGRFYERPFIRLWLFPWKGTSALANLE